MQQIQITAPLSAALERTKAALFRPFDLGKWCILGFTAWLATLGEGGVGGFNVNVGRSLDADSLEQAQQWIRSHLGLLIITAAVALLMIVAFSLLFAWIRGRGTFMFIDNLVHQRAEIAESWRRWKRQGNSCFVFTIVFGFITFSVFALLFGAGILGVVIFGGGRTATSIAVGASMLFVLVLPLLIAVSYVWLFFQDFVVLIMYRLQLTAGESWRIFGRLFSAHKGDFILYGLFRFVLNLAIGAIVMAAGLLTCCCGFILLALPYVGAVVMLPITATLRFYNIEFLKQFGPDFDASLT